MVESWFESVHDKLICVGEIRVAVRVGGSGLVAVCGGEDVDDVVGVADASFDDGLVPAEFIAETLYE
jgi:hypothetical protein